MFRRKLVYFALLTLFCAAPATGQGPKETTHDPSDPRLPNGKSQKEEILKADHEKSLEDASKLIQLTEDLKIELEKNDRHVLSVSMLKKLDDIEKLSKRIRSRLRRY
ncbi:MAG TPA: hypothetical protein VEX68_16785 [Bryobacteraceae bacterium]|nr:hypothetical protein [Bryobacteraceae bacterium]